MTLLEAIKTAQLQARKQRNALATNVLTTLVGEAIAIGKNAGNRETSDAEIVALAKKFIKNIDETIAVLKDSDRIATLEQEREIVSQFLPKQLSSEQLHVVIVELTEELNAHTKRDMGKLMNVLKERYSGQYDGAVASSLIKSILE